MADGKKKNERHERSKEFSTLGVIVLHGNLINAFILVGKGRLFKTVYVIHYEIKAISMTLLASRDIYG